MSSIKQFSNEVNMTVQQVKSMSWGEVAKFIFVGLAKLIAFAITFWIIRNF